MRLSGRASVIAALLIVGSVLVPGLALARTPRPSPPPSEGDIALGLVRAQDPRFADLPTIDEAQQTMASTFDFAPLLAGSWISVAETAGTITDVASGFPTWLDPGLGRVVEVMLVAGCPTTLKGAIRRGAPDPCGWRHTWLYHVARDGTLTTIAEAGSLDTPACYRLHTANGVVWPPAARALACDPAG